MALPFASKFGGSHTLELRVKNLDQLRARDAVALTKGGHERSNILHCHFGHGTGV